MELIDFEEKDFLNLYDFMSPIWHETYGNILPKAQIDFLLNKYFSTAALEYYRAQGYQYKKIDGVGVLVFVEREKDVYLDKLYLTPSVRGKNYPAFVFAWLQRLGKDITLNVNQSNERAVRCYLKNGFVILSKTDIDLGDGMVNCDYVMQKRALS